jgi:hypothetical protein
MTEFQPYGVRHFLRDADPEGVSELRRRSIPLIDGTEVAKGGAADTDALRPGDLLEYRTLVLRRSPLQSRPPSPYELVREGTYYEVWQRPEEGFARPLVHLPLGTESDVVATPPCRQLQRLAAQVPRGGRLVAAQQPPVTALRLGDLADTAGWEPAGERLVPRGGGDASGEIVVPRAGAYEVWLEGSVRGATEVEIGSQSLGPVRNRLNNSDHHVGFGTAGLAAGSQPVRVSHGGGDLHPGSGGDAFPLGPLVLEPAGPADAGLLEIEPGRVQAACGRPLDWVEALPSN